MIAEYSGVTIKLMKPGWFDGILIVFRSHKNDTGKPSSFSKSP